MREQGPCLTTPHWCTSVNKHHLQPSSPKWLTLRNEGSTKCIKTFEEILQDEKGDQKKKKKKQGGGDGDNQ